MHTEIHVPTHVCAHVETHASHICACTVHTRLLRVSVRAPIVRLSTCPGWKPAPPHDHLPHCPPGLTPPPLPAPTPLTPGTAPPGRHSGCQPCPSQVHRPGQPEAMAPFLRPPGPALAARRLRGGLAGGHGQVEAVDGGASAAGEGHGPDGGRKVGQGQVEGSERRQVQEPLRRQPGLLPSAAL